MNINKINVSDLKKLQEGLVFLGCGGDLKQWTDGIKNWLIEDKMVNDINFIKSIHKITNESGRIDLIFELISENILWEKLSLWRLEILDCKWISDYVDQIWEEIHG